MTDAPCLMGMISLVHACDRAIIMRMIEGLQTVQPRHRPDLSGVACLVSGADRCSVSSFRACVPVRRVLRGLRCCLCCAAVPGALGAGVSTGGVYRERRGWGGSIVSVEKIQKRRFSAFLLPTPTPPLQIKTYLIVQVSKNSKNNKKTPFGA